MFLEFCIGMFVNEAPVDVAVTAEKLKTWKTLYETHESL